MSDQDTNKTTIVLSISKECKEKLEAQIDFLRRANIPELSEISSVEELINFYVEQLANSSANLGTLQAKMEELFKTFSEKGINMKAIIRTFTKDDDALEDDYNDDTLELDLDDDDDTDSGDEEKLMFNNDYSDKKS